jgi:hypothetical protein
MRLAVIVGFLALAVYWYIGAMSIYRNLVFVMKGLREFTK